MEFCCEKYKETMAADGAYCRHPTEYCKFRTACLINFVSKENRARAESAVTDLDNVSLQDR